MAYVYLNLNPENQRVGDCTVRAISKALDESWEMTYIGLAAEGLSHHDMPSSNYVWGMYLQKNGFMPKAIESLCPKCVTVADFAEKHNKGVYVLATQGHVVTIIDGNIYDSFDSSDEPVLYYFEKEY